MKDEVTKKVTSVSYELSMPLDPDPERNDNWQVDRMIIDYVNAIYIASLKHVIKLSLKGKTVPTLKTMCSLIYPNFLTNPEDYQDMYSDPKNLDEHPIMRNPLYYPKKWRSH